jgi:hypothetical protein
MHSYITPAARNLAAAVSRVARAAWRSQRVAAHDAVAGDVPQRVNVALISTIIASNLMLVS